MESANSNGTATAASIAGSGVGPDLVTVKMGDDTDSVNSASQDQQTLSESDQKRRKKLELNRIASRVSDGPFTTFSFVPFLEMTLAFVGHCPWHGASQTSARLFRLATVW